MTLNDTIGFFSYILDKLKLFIYFQTWTAYFSNEFLILNSFVHFLYITGRTKKELTSPLNDLSTPSNDLKAPSNDWSPNSFYRSNALNDRS